MDKQCHRHEQVKFCVSENKNCMAAGESGFGGLSLNMFSLLVSLSREQQIMSFIICKDIDDSAAAAAYKCKSAEATYQ